LRRAFPAVSVAVLAVIPLSINHPYLLRVGSLVCAEAMAVLGLSVIFGFAGQFSFGQAGLYGVGAYSAAIVLTRTSWGFPAALLISASASALAGGAMGLLATRVGGDYLALATLAAAEILRLLMLNWTRVTGGAAGIASIPSPSFLGIGVTSGLGFYLLGLTLLSVCVYVVWRLGHSTLGLAMKAVRDDELAARAAGTRAGVVKAKAFLIGGALAGVAGTFFAVRASFVSSVSFDVVESFTLMIMLILGGREDLFGPVLGAAIVVEINEQLNGVPGARLGLTGAFMLAIVFWRGGVLRRARLHLWSAHT
jgi:branched-chain amino acid transport system permease protein